MYCVHADPYVWNEGVVSVAQVLMDKVKRFEGMHNISPYPQFQRCCNLMGKVVG